MKNLWTRSWKIVIGIGITTAIVASLYFIFFREKPFVSSASAGEADLSWPTEGKLEMPKTPSLADRYGERPPATPAVIKPEDSPGQIAVANFIAKLGVMPTVKVKSGDKATKSSSEFVDGDDKLRIVTTRNYDTVKSVDDILILVTRPDIYPGSLIQGASLAEGLPVELRLQAKKRMPMRYVLLGATPNDVPKAKDNDPPDAKHPHLSPKAFQTLGKSDMVKPGMASADAFRMKMMGELRVPAHYSKNSSYAYSAEHLNTQLGVTAKWAGGAAAVNVGLSNKKDRVTALLLLRQEYFRIAIEAPRPAKWFTSDIKVEDFDGGDVGANNTPCFVSSVGYGRVVLLLAESEQDKKHLTGALDFAYNGGFASANMQANMENFNILKTATYRLMVYGGDPMAAPNGPKDEKLQGEAGLNAMAKLIVPDFNPKFALPISYEVRNLHNNRVVAIASASAHQLISETSSPYQYQVRIDNMNINDTYRSFLGIGLNSNDGEFHIEITDSAGKKIGTIDKKLGKGPHGIADYLPLGSGSRRIQLSFVLRERNDKKGTGNSPIIDLAELRKLREHSRQYTGLKFDNGNQIDYTVDVIPPEKPNESKEPEE